ncbi:MAG: hypothetical protein LBQ87_09820 [Candidatus Fibromonas sp.]|jgi:hypothetical protein|nr:hypothetical protein [Candidatus Fibromonas sp.]
MFQSCKLLLPVLAGILYLGCSKEPEDSVKEGKTTRYWDACKPSCAWTNNTKNSPNGTAKSCSIDGSILSSNNTPSSCGGGTAFACMDQAPWAVDDSLSYGFAASHTTGDCGKCYELQFTSGSVLGKTMVVMISNIGGDVKPGQFDLMIPGGGVGQFNALSNQITHNGSTPNLGQQYGGFRSACGANNKDCVQNMCNSNFGTPALAYLKAGCEWYINWFNIADNPKVDYKQIDCPQALIGRYSNGKY